MAIRYQHTQVGWWIVALAIPLMLVAAVLALRESLAGGVAVAALATFVLLSLVSLKRLFPMMACACGLGLG